ncbi:MAG: hypothetical protein UT39_C0001G0007 [Candidatus Woesebacteria bacterium GW2011_GWA1_39_21]|uniref:Uncharacterized protein n=1 Tax=Candidatus Woesebacteria bacterium GW2011_GWA1_39_21 TaxID=1618550 RepID=A0A0G0RE57_9BACT|nr:MAG: hypothetical protein UT39_C0001G0007 [Candidatus Woesebacteria bacterium GW2011_GWA1_39_21]
MATTNESEANLPALEKVRKLPVDFPNLVQSIEIKRRTKSYCSNGCMADGGAVCVGRGIYDRSRAIVVTKDGSFVDVESFKVNVAFECPYGFGK